MHNRVSLLVLHHNPLELNKCCALLLSHTLKRGYIIKVQEIVTLVTILITLNSADDRKNEYEILSEFIVRLLGQELAIGNKITDLTRLFDFLDLIATSSIISSNLPPNQIGEIFEYIREKNELSEKRIRQIAM